MTTCASILSEPMVEIQDTRFWQFKLLKKVLCFRLLLQHELETDPGSQWQCHSENYLKGTIHCYQAGTGTWKVGYLMCRKIWDERGV